LTPSREDARRRERFRELYADNYPLILGYAMRRCAQPEDAADVVAETFLAAWRRLDDVPTEHARTWLYGVARRVLANQLRGGRRRQRLGERLGEELRHFASATPERHRDGELELAASAFAALTEQDRELLALAGWEGLAGADLGRVLGCSANAARIRLHRARRRFARRLEALDGSRAAARAEQAIDGLAKEDVS
jgi:RNA polymerase sigma factor (sigma-70 family)